MDCTAAPLVGDTNAAVSQYAVGLKFALKDCNADKAALRDWKAQMQAKPAGK